VYAVSNTGSRCLDAALLSLQALLSTPEPGMVASPSLHDFQRVLTLPAGTDDPQDAQVARQYLSSRDEFIATAKFWTESYATAAGGDDAKARPCLLWRNVHAGPARWCCELTLWSWWAAHCCCYCAGAAHYGNGFSGGSSARGAGESGR
jgi:hypothetical protein